MRSSPSSSRTACRLLSDDDQPSMDRSHTLYRTLSHRSRAPGLHRRNLDQDQHGAASRVGAVWTTVARQSAIRPLEDHDLPGRSASRSGHRTVADRRTHRWPELPPVRRGDPRAHAQAGRHRHHRQPRLAQRQGHSASHPRRCAKLFFLPKYSPDLNPIEKFFAKLKHWLRKAARRTVDAVYNAIAEILPLTSPAECSNYFAQAGYAQPETITL